MPGGLAIAAASSAAYAEMGAQAERALNTGWVFDQRQDNAGGFLTNASPTSSGLTFQSTGDGRLFYQIGRGLQVIQVAGTAICTVGQSSFSGGITNVFLNQFSTQAGLSTALSTGTITSVAASPIVVGSTVGNLFSGGLNVAPTTGSGATWNFGQSATLQTRTSTGGNDAFWPAQFASTTLAADVLMSTAAFAWKAIITKTLAVGTWWINTGITITSTEGGQDVYARIDDGTNTFASADYPNLLTSTSASAAIALGTIVSHTTALAYNLSAAGTANTTGAKAKAITWGQIASTGATFFTAVKIG